MGNQTSEPTPDTNQHIQDLMEAGAQELLKDPKGQQLVQDILDRKNGVSR